jgi:hypothetical protein
MGAGARVDEPGAWRGAGRGLMSRGRGGGQDVEFRFDMARDVPTMRGDTGRIKQAPPPPPSLLHAPLAHLSTHLASSAPARSSTASSAGLGRHRLTAPRRRSCTTCSATPPSSPGPASWASTSPSTARATSSSSPSPIGVPPTPITTRGASGGTALVRRFRAFALQPVEWGGVGSAQGGSLGLHAWLGVHDADGAWAAE